jgi:hypothetical protein
MSLSPTFDGRSGLVHSPLGRRTTSGIGPSAERSHEFDESDDFDHASHARESATRLARTDFGESTVSRWSTGEPEFTPSSLLHGARALPESFNLQQPRNPPLDDECDDTHRESRSYETSCRSHWTSQFSSRFSSRSRPN